MNGILSNVILLGWTALSFFGAVSLIREPQSTSRQRAFWGAVICLNVWAAAMATR